MGKPYDPKTRGRVNLEEVQEETYKDLLPYEMEVAEFVSDFIRTEDRIEEGISQAKRNPVNAWGHSWRKTPTLEDIINKQARERLTEDPVRDMAVKEYRTEKKTPEELLQSIQMLLFWDYRTNNWRKLNADPNWNGYDELAEIADRLINNGFGPKMTKPKK